MPVKAITINGFDGHAFKPEIFVSGNTLTFSGSGSLANYEVSVPETTYTFQASLVTRSVSGYVVRDAVSGKVSFVVDEVQWDGVDQPFPFGADQSLRVLERVVWFEVPAKVDTFDSIDVHHVHLVKYVPPKSHTKEQRAKMLKEKKAEKAN